MRLGLLNATGYTGGEMIRYLAGHPDLELTSLTARSRAGSTVGDVLPWVRATARPDYAELRLTPELDGSVDAVVSCLPHNASAAQLAPLLDDGVPVVDVSADFRLHDLEVYRASGTASTRRRSGSPTRFMASVSFGVRNCGAPSWWPTRAATPSPRNWPLAPLWRRDSSSRR